MNTLKQILGYMVVMLIIAISIKYEFDAYSHILSQMKSSINALLWPAIVAVTFNLGKLLSFMSIIEAKSKSFFKLWKSYFAVSFLMVNSFLCAFCVMSYSLESSQLQQVASEQQKHAEAVYSGQLEAIDNKFAKLAKLQEKKHAQDVKNINDSHQVQIDKYDQELTEEMEDKNKITKVFKGDEYHEIARKLAVAKKTKADELLLINRKNTVKINGLTNQMKTELDALDKTYLASLNNLSIEKIQLSGSERIHDQMIVSSLKVFNGVTNSNVSYIHLIAFLSFLMAFIVESLAFTVLGYIHSLQREEHEQINPPEPQNTTRQTPELGSSVRINNNLHEAA